MTKRSSTKIGPRDLELLIAIDRSPLTVSQLLRLSQTFDSPFRDEANLRRRLRSLSKSGLIRSWRYAFASNGPSPQYFKLSRDGFRYLYGMSAVLPRRRHFEEIRHGHHPHTHALSETITRLIECGQKRGVELTRFARENSLRLQASGFTLYPDCAFQLIDANHRQFNFVVELDNGTERIRTAKDIESIERKFRGYDAHQQQFAASDDRRYLVLLITTSSTGRLNRIMNHAASLMHNPQRTVFLGTTLDQLRADDPFCDAIFSDHRGLKRMILPRTKPTASKNTTPSLDHSQSHSTKPILQSR